MKLSVTILVVLLFIVSLSLSAKENRKMQFGSKSQNPSFNLPDFNQSHLLGLTKEELNTLPKSFKSRIPDHLTKTDSLLISTDFQSATAQENQITPFSNGELHGTIIKMSGRNYKVMDDKERLLGLFHKSHDGQRYTLINANGDVLFNSQVLHTLIYIFSVLFSLLISIFIYSLVL